MISMPFAPSIVAFRPPGIGGSWTAREKAGWPLVGCPEEIAIFGHPPDTPCWRFRPKAQ